MLTFHIFRFSKHFCQVYYSSWQHTFAKDDFKKQTSHQTRMMPGDTMHAKVNSTKQMKVVFLPLILLICDKDLAVFQEHIPICLVILGFFICAFISKPSLNLLGWETYVGRYDPLTNDDALDGLVVRTQLRSIRTKSNPITKFT